MGIVALRLGFEATDSDDPTMWLAWAEQSSDPACCLYCAGNFMAIPPIAGEVPPAIDGQVKALAAASLLALQRPAWAVEIIETFLGLSLSHYQSESAMQEALERSRLRDLDSILQVKMIATLVDALGQVTGHGLQIGRAHV